MRKIWEVVAREVRTILPATIFFLCLFHLIFLTRAAIVSDLNLTALRATVATIGALIVAKAILVVESLPFARLFPDRLVLNALWKGLLFGVVTMLFRLIEELIPLIAKHQSLPAAAAKFLDEVSWPQFWVFQLWFFAALFLYALAFELVRIAGPDKVRAALWGPTAVARDR